MTNWTLWTRPRPAMVFISVMVLLTISVSILSAITHPISRRDLIYFAVIVTIGVVAAEASRQVERMRRRLTDTAHVNLTSVWTLSAALLLTPGLAVATVVILYGHLWLRSWYRIKGVHPYRLVFSASTVVMSCLAVRGIADLAPFGNVLADVSPAGLAWTLLIILVYSVVNSGLIAIALAFDENDRSIGRLLGTLQDNSVEHATLCLGVLTALVMEWRPWLIVLMFLPLYVLHNSVLIKQLEHAATTDDKTGLLNATSWQSLATNELHRAKRHQTEASVLMIDLDHFKRVNDVYGHLVGDDVLRAVANAMKNEVRAFDLCGRFGGEEFVVLLPETGLMDAIQIADRIGSGIRGLRIEHATPGESLASPRLSASIGVATFPDVGTELDELLLAADNAMFAAKDSGRDQVRAVMPSRALERRSPSVPESAEPA